MRTARAFAGVAMALAMQTTMDRFLAGRTIAVAESCTGGLVSAAITDGEGDDLDVGVECLDRALRRVDLGLAVVLPLVGHAREPLFEEQVGRAIDLRRGTQPAGSDPRGGLALHQGHDDLAPESRHAVTRADALVAEDLPLASG